MADEQVQAEAKKKNPRRDIKWKRENCKFTKPDWTEM